MKQFKNIAFGLTMLIYLWVPFNMIQSVQKVLKEGTVYRFKSIPVDPYDAFRGRYIILNIGSSVISVDQAKEKFNRQQTVYLGIKVDENGFANFENAFAEIPEGQDYVKTTVAHVSPNSITIRFPENMKQYFINEKLAPLAEKTYRELTRNNRTQPDAINAYLDVRILEGTVVIEELYLKGKPIVEYLEQLEVEK